MQKGRFYKAKGHGLRNDCDSSCECLIISCLCFFFIPGRIKVPKSVIRSQTKMSSTGFSLPNILYMVCPTPKDDCTQAQPVTVGCPSRYHAFSAVRKKAFSLERKTYLRRWVVPYLFKCISLLSKSEQSFFMSIFFASFASYSEKERGKMRREVLSPRPKEQKLPRSMLHIRRWCRQQCRALSTVRI